MPDVQKHHLTHDIEVIHNHRLEQLDRAHRRISQLREVEARLGWLLLMEKISEEAYDQLGLEWTKKIQHAERTLAKSEQEGATHLNDLDAALSLMAIMSQPYALRSKNRINYCVLLSSIL